ncbi:hypothetical protein D9758_008708 [Tetrapyrgos nigripes]|uniref:Phosphatidate phosphatase APP1 catalytic domain-containing protein n=1 Tax=Tetrapyrgos nigripes TaxID=182062 RepID=A0A8H5FY71_9AGAR|nr:hypothetical protein D9758_008708 [Tetrapyrgos nigripes]
MSQGPSKWRSTATSATASRLSSFKNYISQQDFKNSLPQAIQRQLDNAKPGSWREWAGQKINRSGNSPSGSQTKLAMFPGWAARKYRPGKNRDVGGAFLLFLGEGVFLSFRIDAFEIDVYVSGFATVYRAPEFATRSQKAFMRLAKGYAALPKLEGQQEDPNEVLMSYQLTPSTEDLMKTVKLPPRPMENTDDYEAEALEQHFQRLNANMQDSLQTSPHSSSVDLPLSNTRPKTPIRRPTQDSTHNPINAVSEELRKLHANLEGIIFAFRSTASDSLYIPVARLQPFWSSVLPNRLVRINIFASHHKSPENPSTSSDADVDRVAIEHGPIATQDVMTAADGSFQARFRIDWEEMCQHDAFLHIAFGDPLEEHDILVTAQVIPPSPPRSTYSSASSSTSDLENYSQQTPVPDCPPPVHMHISLTHTPLRVVSDVDDTVKLSNISSGARAVFHNVFVKELSELIIPGMGEWYTDMWRKGARFHYVSNGPFELLPVIGEFFKIAHLPSGSIKLRSYAGKSLFSGLLSAPAARKRAGVLDIMDAFPDSKFILVGDSGEQDLELYAELARDKPSQVLAICIRDTLIGIADPLSDPTGRGSGYYGPADDVPPLQLPPKPPYSRKPSQSQSQSSPSPRRALTGPERTLTPMNTTSMTQSPPNTSSNTSYIPRTPQTQTSRKTSMPTPLSAAPSYFSSSTIMAEPEVIAPMSASVLNTPYSTGRKSPWGSKSSLSMSVLPNTPYSAPNASNASNMLNTSFGTQSSRPRKSGSVHSVMSNATSASASGSAYGNGNGKPLADSERKRYDLQVRVWNARSVIPDGILLRVFRDPGECWAEMDRLIERLGK